MTVRCGGALSRRSNRRAKHSRRLLRGRSNFSCVSQTGLVASNLCGLNDAQHGSLFTILKVLATFIRPEPGVQSVRRVVGALNRFLGHAGGRDGQDWGREFFLAIDEDLTTG